VFETYWTTGRGVEAMNSSYRLLDLTPYGRQEKWEDSPTGWLKGKQVMRSNGRPTAQWSRLEAGRSDNLDTTPRSARNPSLRRTLLLGPGPLVIHLEPARFPLLLQT
jgi:hypothetical protein